MVIVPDLDVTGIDSADITAARLRGIANTVRIARLPGEIRATKGDGVREVLARADGEADLRQAILDAVLWQPFQEGYQANWAGENFEESHSSGRGCKKSRRKPCKATGRSRHNTWTPICTDQGRTDIANSRRFVDANRTRIRFCHSWGKWLVWTGTKWEIDCDGSIIRMAIEIADTLWVKAKHCPTKEVVNFAVSTSCRQKIQAMQELATPEVAVRVDELDAQPWLLNCPNGVVDLQIGELRPHRPEDHLTKLCPTNFNPQAESKCWDQFLESVFGGDEETIAFVQRYFGYCLTGSVTEQVLTVCYGGGSNGKSTLLNAIQTTMGADYASAAPPGLLTEKKNEAHPTELAGLFGLRLAIAQETAQGEKLAEPIIKQLTGGDRISARRMREDFWNFMPTHKLILVTNHKPRVKGTDHAIWRRLVLIPFERRFWNPAKGESGPPELCQDKDLSTKLAAESEAILAWMVRGCIDWHHDGLKIPCSVRHATDEYRTEQDVLGRFMSDIFVKSADCQIRFSDLYSALERWCHETGDFRPSKKFVGSWLKDNGYKDKQSGVRWYTGIGFKPQLE